MKQERENNWDSIPIYRWMGTGLQLKGNKLVVYALIYNATETEGGWKGSIPSMREWTATKSLTPLYSAVSRLLLDGLIVRGPNGTLRANGVHTPKKGSDIECA